MNALLRRSLQTPCHCLCKILAIMRSVLLAACVALVVAMAALHARVPQSAAVVTIDVTVVDRAGRPVTNLAAADFQVELDRRPGRVLTATYLPSGAPMAGAVGPAFDAVTASPVYRLTVEPPAGAPAGATFAVGVAVARPGTQVLGAPHAVVAPAPVAAAALPAAAAGRSIEDRLRDAIATGRPERGLPIRLGRALRRGADATQVLLDVQIEIPASAKAPLSARLGVVDGRGAIRSAGQQIPAPESGNYRLDFSLPLAPGPYRLRFAAADAAGTVGAVETAVSAELAPVGWFAASDLLRWTATAGAEPRPLLFEELPSDADTLGASLELYGTGVASGTPDVLVKMTLGFAQGSLPAEIERVVSPDVRDGALVAEAQFPLDRVGRGTYVLRADVLSGSTVLGTVSATIIKP